LEGPGEEHGNPHVTRSELSCHSGPSWFCLLHFHWTVVWVAMLIPQTKRATQWLTKTQGL